MQTAKQEKNLPELGSPDCGSDNPTPSTDFRRKLADLERIVLALKRKNEVQEEKLAELTNELKELKTTRRQSHADYAESDTRIYVGNISPTTGLHTLELYFSKYGIIDNAFFFREFSNCRNAFIDFHRPSAAIAALHDFHMISGRQLSVGKARRRYPPLRYDKENEHVYRNFKLKQNDSKTNRYRPY